MQIWQHFFSTNPKSQLHKVILMCDKHTHVMFHVVSFFLCRTALKHIVNALVHCIARQLALEPLGSCVYLMIKKCVKIRVALFGFLLDVYTHQNNDDKVGSFRMPHQTSVAHSCNCDC